MLHGLHKIINGLVHVSTDCIEILYGKRLVILHAINLNLIKRNEPQRTPLVILCNTLWSPAFFCSEFTRVPFPERPPVPGHSATCVLQVHCV
jgi:hypothetical protein